LQRRSSPQPGSACQLQPVVRRRRSQSQFSTLSPFTWPKCRVLLVTTINPRARACAAIRVSNPMGVPLLVRSAATVERRSAAISSKGKTSTSLTKARIAFRSFWDLLVSAPNRSSARVIELMARSEGACSRIRAATPPCPQPPSRPSASCGR
jgi:hypothetical protein